MNPIILVAATAAAIKELADREAARRVADCLKREPKGVKHPDTIQTHRAFWKRVEKRRRGRKAARLQKIRAKNGAAAR